MIFNSVDEILELLEQENTSNEEKWLIPESELDDDQYRILNRLDGDFMVSGCAGSGKTILAIYRLKNIIREKKGNYLFIVYTITLKEFIKNALEDEDINQSTINVFYKDEFIRMINNEEIEKISYDYIIVDEVQDLNIEFIELLVRYTNKQIICLGDDAQQLYARHNGGINLKEIADKINISGSDIEYLNKNYRVSKSIAKFAGKIIDDDNKLMNSCVNDYGIDPIIQKFNSLNEELDFIIKYIEEEAIMDSAILVQSNSLVKRVVRYLKDKGIELEYKDDKNHEINFRVEGLKVLTYHSSKGLEFENVFLPGCEIDSENNNFKEALYVACTRAKKRLLISYSKNLSKFIKNTIGEGI